MNRVIYSIIVANFRKVVFQLISKLDIEITAINYDDLFLKANEVKAVVIEEPVCKKSLDNFFSQLDEFKVHNRDSMSNVVERIADINLTDT
jgi:hypothetical protein